MLPSRFTWRALRLAAAGLCTVAAVSGCGTSPPTRFFTLEPVAPAAVAGAGAGAGAVMAPYSGPALQVRAVHLPPAWDRIELIAQLTPGQLQVREFDQWAAPLGRTARQTLTQDLAARLPPGSVLFPQAMRGDAAELTVDILSLSIDGRSAVMQVSWALRNPATPAVRSASLLLETPMAGDGGEAIASALAHLLGRLADEIASAVAAPGSS